MSATAIQQCLADATGAGVAAGLGVFMLVIWGIVLLGSIFVIWMLIDCLTSSMPTSEKLLWALIIIFLHLIGAILYYAIKRSSATGRARRPERPRRTQRWPGSSGVVLDAVAI